MVREFYANVEERDGDYVFVWGMEAPFSHVAINWFFKSNGLETWNYNLVMSKEFDA